MKKLIEKIKAMDAEKFSQLLVLYTVCGMALILLVGTITQLIMFI